MGSYDRAEAIVHALTVAGIRATIDPGAVNPPAVLVVPPARTYDVSCGFTARWTIAAIAPAPLGADRSTWAALDHLVDVVATVVDVDTAELVSYQINGQSLPAYLVNFEEMI